MDDILKEATEIIRRLGTAAEDCISCAHSSEGGCELCVMERLNREEKK